MHPFEAPFGETVGGAVQSITMGNGKDSVTIGAQVNVVNRPSFIDAGRGFDVLVGRANLNVLAGAWREIGFEQNS